MKRYTKAQRTAAFYTSMAKLGFTAQEADTLRLAQLTLHRWAERECNGEVERDEETGKTYCYRGSYVQANDPRRKRRVRDLETGALKRAHKIVSDRNTREWVGYGGKISEMPGLLHLYHQTDPRGVALYLVTNEQLGGHALDAAYNRGFGVCI